MLKIKLEDIPLDDSATWELMQSGQTVGVFQVESFLGIKWCKRIRPENIEQLAAIGALLRPSCLESLDERGVSTTENYARRKNNEEVVPSVHPVVDECLKTTYGLMIYQEDMLEISKKVAGFSLSAADQLRRGIGKKLPEVIAKCKIEFLDGCRKEQIVSDELAQHLWDMIEKSQRYAFNKAHAVRYAIVGYQTAFLKTNYLVLFFTKQLENTKNSGKPFLDIEKFVRDAQRNFSISIMIPSISGGEVFHINKEKANSIRFGLGNIKGVGEKQLSKLSKLKAKIAASTWPQFLWNYSSSLNSTVVVALIKSGAFDHFKLPRQTMLYQYEQFKEGLNDKEIQWAISNQLDNELAPSISKIAQARVSGGFGRKDTRRVDGLNSLVNMLNSPPYSLVDTPITIADGEKEVLGVSLTCSRLDGKNVISSADATFLNELMQSGQFIKKDQLYSVAIEIERSSEYNINKGQNKGKSMGFVSGFDGQAQLEMVAFSEEWALYKDVLQTGETVILTVAINTQKKSAIIKNVELI
jgi:DNA polymerase III alpha subunit